MKILSENWMFTFEKQKLAFPQDTRLNVAWKKTVWKTVFMVTRILEKMFKSKHFNDQKMDEHA